MYHRFLYGNTVKDPNLLFGNPRAIRSDEWLVTTQMTVIQAVNGFPRFNDDFGNGRDMSVVADVPYKDWSIVFKPQNLIFFVLPLEYAFAFKWWLLLYLLIISSYFFISRLFPSQRRFAILTSLGIGLSPFVFWWYQTITIAPLFYGFFILLLIMKIVDQDDIPLFKKSWQANAFYTALLAYLLASFALVMYPPFQLPVALVVAIFSAGYLLQKRSDGKLPFKKLLTRFIPVAGGVLGAVAIVGLFLITRSDAIHKVNNTVYPGNRIIGSGGLNPLNVFDSFLMPLLQSSARAVHFFNNQSEASNFILLLPFLLLPGFVLLIYTYRKHRKIDWLLLGLQLGSLLLLARVFVPFGDLFYKLLFLHKVPNERLIIGLGFIGILHTLVFMKRLYEYKLRPHWLLTFGYGGVCFAALIAIGLQVADKHPLFINNPAVITMLAGMFSMLIVLTMVNRIVLAAAAVLIFSLVSVVRIHPLYRGLGALTDSQVIKKIQAVSQPEDTWVTADNIVFENFGLVSNRDSLSGVSYYPDVSFWRQLDQSQAEAVTNRYAHVTFSSDPALNEKIRLVQLDSFIVKLECSDFVRREVDFVLSTQLIQLGCVKPVDTVRYPQITLYLYEIE